MKLYKWSGAGNLFVVLDGRNSDVSDYRKPENIQKLCSRYSTDGLMIMLASATGNDFGMEFYNPDGTGGMMCGNGGRCIAAFADYLGLKPSKERTYVFDAADGVHCAQILSRDSENKWTVRLRMIDVHGVKEVLGGHFLNTGTRHFVKIVGDVKKVNVDKDGRELRLHKEFAPEGSNANFVSASGDLLHVRTFEKGVERETMACGTGLTASAIAAYKNGIAPQKIYSNGVVEYALRARHDLLGVEFLPAGKEDFKDIFLTGPAELLP